MSEVENLKEQLNDLQKSMMRENCFNMLKDFVFYFEVDDKKENILWTKNEKVREIVNQMKMLIQSEGVKIADYYSIESEYAHIAGSNECGHSHSHSHEGHTHTHMNTHTHSQEDL